MTKKVLFNLALILAVPAWLIAMSQTSAAAVVNTVPYLETFELESGFGNFMVLDNNHDGSTWSWYNYDECARYY
jgi:hypothetical protein